MYRIQKKQAFYLICQHPLTLGRTRAQGSTPGDSGSDPRVLMVSLPLQDNLSVPLTEEDLDGSSGVLFPFYDPDTSILYIVGKVSLARGRGGLGKQPSGPLIRKAELS